MALSATNLGRGLFRPGSADAEAGSPGVRLPSFQCALECIPNVLPVEIRARILLAARGDLIVPHEILHRNSIPGTEVDHQEVQ